MTNLTDEQLIERCEKILNDEGYGGTNDLTELISRFKSLSTGKDGVICPHCDECVDLKQPAPVSVEEIMEALALTKGTIHITYNHARPYEVEAILNVDVIRTALQTLFSKK